VVEAMNGLNHKPFMSRLPLGAIVEQPGALLPGMAPHANALGVGHRRAMRVTVGASL